MNILKHVDKGKNTISDKDKLSNDFLIKFPLAIDINNISIEDGETSLLQ